MTQGIHLHSAFVICHLSWRASASHGAKRSHFSFQAIQKNSGQRLKIKRWPRSCLEKDYWLSTKLRSLSLRLGCLSLRSALASIW
ncbi:MAG: hypothetical protein Q4G71_17970, partial [Pseudomonadota bacterium]|nr:hypothetical protein [Pseudomonadota bacterium]